MRLLPILLLTILALPLIGEDVDRDGLRDRLLGAQNGVQASEASLLLAAREAEMTALLSPALLDQVRIVRTAIDQQVAALKDPRADTAPAERAITAGGRLNGALSSLADALRQGAQVIRDNPRAVDSPILAQFRDLLRARVVTVTAAALAGEDVSEPFASVLRRLRFELGLTLFGREREDLVCRSHLDAQQSPLREYLSWNQRVRGEIDVVLKQPPVAVVVGDDQIQLFEQAKHALDELRELSDAWWQLLELEEQRRVAELPPAPERDGPGLLALRASLAKRVELEVERVRLLSAPQPLEVAVQTRLEQLDREREALVVVSDAISNTLNLQDRFIAVRTTLNEWLGKCPETARKDLQARCDRLGDEFTKVQAQQLKGAVDNDRVDTAEAEGEAQVVLTKLELLDEEARQESSLAENEAGWRAHEKQPALRDQVKRYQDLRDRLAKASAKRFKAVVAMQQIKNRIRMLSLKQELSQGQVSETDEALGRIQQEIEQLSQELREAAAKAGERAKDAKDAERIPLVKPGVDDF